MAKSCIGIDLGGTFIKFCLVDENRRASKTFQLPTPGDGAKGVVAQMAAGVRQLMQEHRLSPADIVGVGIGSPGPLDMPNGVILAMPNISGMDNCPLRDMVSKATGLRAVLENDANAAAYGEFICGAGEGTRNMVLLTLGTGVGGGVVVDGRVVHGSHSMAGELGHMIIVPGGEPCGCGQKGCLEQYCSATFIAKRTVRKLRESGCESSLKATLAAKGTLDARDISEAAAAGDEFAARIWDEAVRYLALGCVNICHIFDPDEIVLGGGMASAGEKLLKPVMQHFRDLHWKLTEPKTRIELARLGNDAGATGAACVAWARFGSDAHT